MTIIIRDYIIAREGEARLADFPHLKAELIARMHINGGRTIEEIMTHYDLPRAQVHAALAYYYENQAELDAAYEKSWTQSRAVKSDDFMAEIDARRKQSG